MIRLVCLCLVLALLQGCSVSGIYLLKRMPPPEVYNEEVLDAINFGDQIEASPYEGILYITDRKPANENSIARFYSNKRGQGLRVGLGEVTYDGDPISASELARISLEKEQIGLYPLKVESIEEYGYLDSVLPYGELTDRDQLGETPLADASFAKVINDKLAASDQKDIYLYVHGYKVLFDNPLLVATELWHFMGFDGVFMSYAWPSTPRIVAYFKDIETARLSGHNFRLTLEYLARNTDAERIHVIGYSAGTRVVITALNELALTHRHKTKQQIRSEMRIGNVILIGSDVDRDQFGATLANGILKVPEMLTVYLSQTDTALRISNFFFRETRLGQIVQSDSVPPAVINWLRESDDITFIDVTDAEESDIGNGHSYFRNSPWASSDILMTLRYNLTPEERGLVPDPLNLGWRFPPDYIERLRRAVLDRAGTTNENPSDFIPLLQPAARTDALN